MSLYFFIYLFDSKTTRLTSQEKQFIKIKEHLTFLSFERRLIETPDETPIKNNYICNAC